MKSSAYQQAGVDIDLATNLLKSDKAKISSTRRPEALAPIGGFGGLFQIDLKKWKQPVMVTSIDGVGTKLMVAAMCNHFMDYIGIGKLRSPLYENVLTGIADACLAQNVTLIGGETAEMPGMYGNDYDLVGCITGIVEKDEIITGENIKPGHVALGLASVGLHTNGFSLARKVLFEKGCFTVDSKPAELGGETVGEALLKPHRCYWPAIREAMARKLPLDGIAHITGGGLYDNVPRILPEGVAAEFDASTIDVPAIFKLIGKLGDIEKHEMYRVFNMGVGMVWFIPETAVAECTAICKDCGIEAHVVGRAVKGDRTSDVLNV